MAVYLQSTSEENLALCISMGLWGASRNNLSGWKRGDQLIAYVHDKLAAVFTVITDPFMDNTPIWADNLYPYRIRLEIEAFIPPESRARISGEQKETLKRDHPNWGTTVVLAHKPLSNSAASLLLATFDRSIPIQPDDAEPIPNNTLLVAPTDHPLYQYSLGFLGSNFGFSVAIPKGDQTRIGKSFLLTDLSIIEIPKIAGFNEKDQRTIANIDVIWFKQNRPTHLFEVENTTGITDGILRMSDLIASIPTLTVEMYICAHGNRKQEVQETISRPTFANNDIGQKCSFLSYQALDRLMNSDRDLLFSANPSELLRRFAERLAA